MDNFKIIYKILKILEKSMDYEEFDTEAISPETLKISQNRWNAIMGMLIDNGYVKGAFQVTSLGGNGIKIGRDAQITLKGLEYLNDNSFMKKAAEVAKGISDFIP